MERGDSVFSPLGVSPSIIPSAISVLGVNDVLLHALIARLALSNNDVVEFETKYDKSTDTVELIISDDVLPYFNQLLGMQRGPKFQSFINWLIGSESLTVGTELDKDPTFVSAGNIISWSGATAGNIADKRLVVFLPAGCLSVVGYNTKVSSEFDGGRVKISLIWVYDSGSENSFNINTAVEVTDITSGFTTPYTSNTEINTFNLINGDIRETLLLDTVGGINSNDLISIIIRRNYDGSPDPQTDLIGIVGLKVELING